MNIWFQPAALQREYPSISSRSCTCICSPEKTFTLQSSLKNTQPKHSLSAEGSLPLWCKGLLPAGKWFANKYIYKKHVNLKEGEEWEMRQSWWPRLMDNIQLPAAHLRPREGAPEDTLWLTLHNISERQENVFINAGCQCPCVCLYGSSPEPASWGCWIRLHLAFCHITSCLAKLTYQVSKIIKEIG